MPLPLVSIPSTPFTSFVGAPVHTDLATLEADIAILGVPCGIPYALGQSRSMIAPAYIREKSMRFRGALGPKHSFDLGGPVLDGRDVRVVDCGDVTGDPMDVRGTVERATEAVRTILSRGAVPIVFGGDDAVPIPVVRAYERFGPIVVVQIDQHLDFKDEVNGVREGYSSPMRRISEMGWVSQIVQLAQHGTGSATTEDVEAAVAAGNALTLPSVGWSANNWAYPRSQYFSIASIASAKPTPASGPRRSAPSSSRISRADRSGSQPHSASSRESPCWWR